MSVFQPPASGYVIGIGSNIEPEVHVPQILNALLDRFTRLYMSRILRTQPIDIVSVHEFLNLAVFLETDMPISALKAICNEIECALGRDRDDPARASKDRVADLDILFACNPAGVSPTLEQVGGVYFQPAVADVYGLLGLAAPVAAPPGVPVRLNGCLAGKMPATIHLDGCSGEIVVVEHGS